MLKYTQKKNPHAVALGRLGGEVGGRARAEKLAPEQRSEIARVAALARWEGRPKPLKATHMGELAIGELMLSCAVLEDGMRVLSQRAFYGALAEGTPGRRRSGDYDGPAFLGAKNLKPFIPAELATTLKMPILYNARANRGGGNVAHGIRAELIPDICDVWLKARAAGALHYTQRSIASKAEVIMRGLAHVGIVALIDEATGYQYDRARNALAEILEKFIAKELAAWVKTFDDDYYREMFRLRGLQYAEVSVKRPAYVGHLTNDIVYKRLAPGVLTELKKVNPRGGDGRRTGHHHRWLTRDVGHPKLKEHLIKVTVLMKAAATWSEFKHMLDRVLPQYGKTCELALPE